LHRLGHVDPLLAGFLSPPSLLLLTYTTTKAYLSILSRSTFFQKHGSEEISTRPPAAAVFLLQLQQAHLSARTSKLSLSLTHTHTPKKTHNSSMTRQETSQFAGRSTFVLLYNKNIDRDALHCRNTPLSLSEIENQLRNHTINNTNSHMLYTRRDKAAAYLFLSRLSSQIPQNRSLSSFSFATSPRKKEKTQSLLLILYLYLQFHKKGKATKIR